MAFSVFKAPEYLQLTATGLFIFRLRVPKEFKPHLSLTELRYSLKTKDIREARQKVYHVMSFIDSFLEGLRFGVFSEFSKEKLLKYLRDGIHKARLNAFPPAVSTCGQSVEDEVKTNHNEVGQQNKPEGETIAKPPQVTFEDILKRDLP